MTTTDHRAEALRLLTPGETHDAGEWTRACPTPDQALVHAVLHLADQLRPADVRGPDHAREGDGTTDPGSGRQAGAQRYQVDDRVQVRDFGPGAWRGEPAADPTPAPVSLPTTPGSVAWTSKGDICALTDDVDPVPWHTIAGPRRRNRGPFSRYLSAGELLGLGVARVFDAAEWHTPPSWMLRSELDAVRARLAEVAHERDEARAKVARVEALVEANSRAETVYVARVRAALAGPDDAGVAG